VSPDEKQLKKLLSESTPVTDENKALKQVLNKSSNVTAFKDVAGLFIGWFWVVLLGFGASAYSAKRRIDLHKNKQPKKHIKNKH
jgi:hypothetical protein